MAKWKRTHNDLQNIHIKLKTPRPFAQWYTETLVFALELRSGYHSSCHYGFHSFPVVDWFCLFMSQTQTRGMMYSSNVSHTNKIYSLKFYEKHKVDDIFPRMSHSKTRVMICSLTLVFALELRSGYHSSCHYGFHSFPVVDWFCLFI
jgi:hypothetical protein